ncbi:MAG: hypothetical protein IJ877_04640 [Candidatus Gastranaerophilales bacterium]|nr:hypothetical protein [Candidatus Gastranaerophilales bacterium]
MGVNGVSSANVFVTNNKQNANSYGLRVAKQRQEDMAILMMNKDSEAVNKNGNIAGLGAGIGGAGTIGALALGIAGGPVGLVIAAAGIGIAGIAGGGIFAGKGISASTQLNQDTRFYELATSDERPDTDLGLLGNTLAKFSVNNSDIPSQEKRDEYAQMLEGGKDLRALTIYESEAVNGTSDYAELHDIKIDSALFTSQTKNTDIDSRLQYEGYSENVITTDKEYGQVFTTFASTLDNGLTDEQMDKLVNIASALSTNLDFSDDAEFFDVNGDGLLNYADLYSLKMDSNSDTKAEFDKVKDIDWSSSEFKDTLDITMAEALKKFDFNGDGNVDNNDRDLMLNSAKGASKDINGDGKIDDKDDEILTSYLQANVSRLERLKQETNALEEAMGGEKCISILENALGA